MDKLLNTSLNQDCICNLDTSISSKEAEAVLKKIRGQEKAQYWMNLVANCSRN